MYYVDIVTLQKEDISQENLSGTEYLGWPDNWKISGPGPGSGSGPGPDKLRQRSALRQQMVLALTLTLVLVLRCFNYRVVPDIPSLISSLELQTVEKKVPGETVKKIVFGKFEKKQRKFEKIQNFRPTSGPLAWGTSWDHFRTVSAQFLQIFGKIKIED